MTTLDTSIPISTRKSTQFAFQHFFEMGESASPFFDPFAQRLSHNLLLKASLFAAFLLAVGWSFSRSILLEPIGQILLVCVFLIVGIPALIESIEDVFLRFDINIDVLMTVAAFSSYFLGSGFEGALLLVLFAISGSLEDAVTTKAKSALASLHKLAPKTAVIVHQDGNTSERAVQDVAIKSKILVRSGEIVPLDGIVVEGVSSVSLAHLTGENIPQRRQKGDEVPSGARVNEGSLVLEVTHTSQDSTVAKIVQLITKGQDAKPKLERWFERFGRAYSLSIIAFFVLFSFVGALILGMPYLGVGGSIYRGLAFLITASPCALILAVPIAYLSSLSSCAKNGIVLKGGVVLDALNDCHQIAFDKTGTLTFGELSLKEIIHESSLSVEEILMCCSSLERHVVHPIAKAICNAAKLKSLQVGQTKDIRSIPGIGVFGKILINGTWQDAFIGSFDGLQAVPTPRINEEMKKAQETGLIVTFAKIGNDVILLSLEDKARPFVKNMLKSLEDEGISAIMLTGDHYESAKKIATELGLKNFEADLSPEDKLNRISELSKKSGLAMVGDGVNDAPSLARATVGIAMGKIASSTAQDAADIVLLRDNIEHLDWLFQKAKKTKKIVLQNLSLALLAICGASIPALFGVVPLWLAVILHEGGTVLVGLNACRLLRVNAHQGIAHP